MKALMAQRKGSTAQRRDCARIRKKNIPQWKRVNPDILKKALNIALGLRVDIALVEFKENDSCGLEATKALIESRFRTKIIAYTSGGSRKAALELLSSNASGYLIGGDFKGITTAIRVVGDGGVYLGSEAAALLIAEVNTMTRQNLHSFRETKLSVRETQILVMIAEGLTNLEMAMRLDIAERTVNVLREKLRAKLGRPSPGWLTRYAIEYGLV